jgi:hypothetical protein
MDYFRDYVNPTTGIPRVGEYILRKDFLNSPSIGDIAMAGGSNIVGVSAEYIATPRGVLRLSPDINGMWGNFVNARNNPGVLFRSTRIDALRNAGATVEFIGQNRQWTSPRGYTERVTGVSQEIRNAYSGNTQRIFNDALDRRAMGNPNLEFLPEVVEPSLLRSGRNIGTGPGGNNGPMSSKPGYPNLQQIQQESIPKHQPRIQSQPQYQTQPTRGKSPSRAFSIEDSLPITKTDRYSSYRMSNGIMNMPAAASAISQANAQSGMSLQMQSQNQGQRQGQPSKIDYARVFDIKSDMMRVQDQTRDIELVRAFRMGSDTARVQKSGSDSLTMPYVSYKSGQASNVIQEQRTQPMQKITPVQITDQQIRPLTRQELVPPPPLPIIPILPGLPTFTPTIPGPGSPRRFKKFTEYMSFGGLGWLGSGKMSVGTNTRRIQKLKSKRKK